MTSKLSFRARALDATKFLPIYCEHEIPDNADCSFINRAVPQMPTGMEKEEETEHHLQLAICAGTVIPTPEVLDIEDVSYYDRLYSQDYKMPRQLIYMQPFSMEADIPDYDMDSEDEQWVSSQAKLELAPGKFEEMMDRLEKGSGQTVVTLQEAKALIKEDDDLIMAVYDYWLNKRLITQHPLISQVRTEARFGVSNHNPYIAFRRRTEKMQTRKNRKNDESSYEKMLKLKRDLTRAVTLLEMVKRREKSKREHLHLNIEVFEKRYQANDFNGQMIAEALAQRPPRPIFSPLLQSNHLSWLKGDSAFSSINRKEKRHYKKRRHKSSSKSHGTSTSYLGSMFSDQPHASDDDRHADAQQSDEEEDEGEFVFRRINKNCQYRRVREPGSFGWGSDDDDLLTDKRARFYPVSIPSDQPGEPDKFLGLFRRRRGRDGRIHLDRLEQGQTKSDYFASLGFTVYDSAKARPGAEQKDGAKTPEDDTPPFNNLTHFRPIKVPQAEQELVASNVDVEPFAFKMERSADDYVESMYKRSPLQFDSRKPRPSHSGGKTIPLGKYLSTAVAGDSDEDPVVIDMETLRNGEPVEPSSDYLNSYFDDATAFCDIDPFSAQLDYSHLEDDEIGLDMLTDTEDEAWEGAPLDPTNSAVEDSADQPMPEEAPTCSSALNSAAVSVDVESQPVPVVLPSDKNEEDRSGPGPDPVTEVKVEVEDMDTSEPEPPEESTVSAVADAAATETESSNPTCIKSSTETELATETQPESLSESDKRRPASAPPPPADDKENDRIAVLPATLRGVVGVVHATTATNTTAPATDGDDEPPQTVVVNGDSNVHAADSSEECILDEQKPGNYVLPPSSKQWMCNCIT